MAYSARLSAVRWRWMHVLSASHPRGFGVGFDARLQMTLAATAVSSAVPRVFSGSRRLGRTSAAKTPNQPLPGKSTPVDTSGDAQPTMHSGGTAAKATAATVAHGRLDARGVQKRVE